jgi:hypothetical protein
LHFDSLQIVLLCLFQLSNFVPTESSVVKGFEVLGVYLDRNCVILYCVLEISFFPKGKTSVVVEISFARL